MIYGLDILGFAACAKISRNTYPPGFALGCFSSLFGDVRTKVDRLLKSGKCPAVRVQLAWKDDHNFTVKDFNSIAAEAKKWRALVLKYPSIKWYFSGACEHKLKRIPASNLGMKVLDALPSMPNVQYVNCPIDEGADVSWAINERHGSKALSKGKTEIFSFDGSACVDADVEKLKARFPTAELWFLWDARFNGRWEIDDNTPRPLRKGWADYKLIKSLVPLIKDCGEVSLPEKWLYKSHAENNGTGDPRAEKPVMISPLKTTHIELKVKGTGESVAVLRYFGPYSGGGFRYYSSKWGFEIAQKPVEVWANGKKWGMINPCFRCGSFR